MRNLIPRFILKKYQQARFQGNMEGTTMFLDINGFTGITESLVSNGNEGAEVLSEIINNIFTPAIDTIYRSGGFITSFAGDSFTAVFPDCSAEREKALNAAGIIQNKFKKIGIQKTRFGRFELKVRIGLSWGKIEWNIIRGDQVKAYYFRGSAIEEAIWAEKVSRKNQIVLSASLADLVSEYDLRPEGGFFILEDSVSEDTGPDIETQLSSAGLKDFVPETVLKLKRKGQFRDVLSCFIMFDQGFTDQGVFTEIIKHARIYGGYFNKIDFNDKGGVILVLFGAPVTREQEYIRACDFAIRIREIDGFNCRTGISSGTAFTGFIGSRIRSEYTAVGNSVNRSARIMAKADLNQIIIDENVHRKVYRIYNTADFGTFSLKGITEENRLYRLLDRKDLATTFISEINYMPGKDHLERILNWLDPLTGTQDKTNAGIIYVEGKTGTGKSRLVKEVKKRLDPSEFHWIYLPCDRILKKSFHPLKFFLNNYFQQSGNASGKDKKNFSRIYTGILNNCTDRELKLELIRARSFLGALMDLHWPNSLFSRTGENEVRFRNLINGIKNLFLYLSTRKPLVLELEDANWIDQDTRYFFKILYGAAREYSLALIVTAETWTRNDRFDLQIEGTTQHRLYLDNFTRSETREFIRLNSEYFHDKNIELSASLEKLIWEKTNGNPLYIEQLLLYLVENKEFLKNDFTSDKIIPGDIKNLMIARFDRLEPDLKSTAQIAAVIGNQFDIRILSLVFENFDELLIRKGEEQDLWKKISGKDYRFKNNYLQEAIYNQLLKKDRKKIHLKVIASIRQYYGKKVDDHNEEIAYNYLGAGNYAQAVLHLYRAGLHAAGRFENDTAAGHFRSALDLITASSIAHWPVSLDQLYLELLDVYLVQGDLKSAGSTIKQLGKFKSKSGDIRDRYIFLQAKYYTSKEKYQEVHKIAKDNIDSIDNPYYRNYVYYYFLNSLRLKGQDQRFLDLAKSVLGKLQPGQDDFFISRIRNILGTYYLKHSRYDKALYNYRESYDLVRKLKNLVLMRTALHHIGIVHSRLGKRRKALEYYLESLKIAKKTGMKGAVGKLYSDIAVIYAALNNNRQALDYYAKALRIAEQTENAKQEGLVLYNLGELHYRLGSRDKALSYLERSKDICEMIGDLEGISYANDLKGDILYSEGQYSRSKQVYLANLKLQKKIGDLEGICHTYGNLGNISRSEKNFEQAENYYRYQYENLTGIGDREGVAKALYNWAMLKVELGDFNSALPKMKKAFELFKDGPYEEIAGRNLAEIKSKAAKGKEN